METTTIYTLIIVITGLFVDNSSKRQRRNYIIFCGIILALISGLRNIYVGTDDTYIYSLSFADDLGKSFSEIWNTENKDPFYYVFTRFVAGFAGNDFQNMLIVYAIIFMVPVCLLFYKESNTPIVSFITFISLGFFFFSMNGVRQTLAMAFVILSYFPLKEKKLIRFLLLIAVASLFHKTALIFLLAYPMARMRLNKLTICLYTAIIVIALTGGEQILKTVTETASLYDERFVYYTQMGSGLSMSGLIQLILLFIFAFANYKKVLLTNKDNIILYNLLILALIFQSMAIFIGEMFRVAMYFSIFLTLLLPHVLEVLPSSKRKLYGVALCGLLLIYFIFIGAGTIPYKFYFQ